MLNLMLYMLGKNFSRRHFEIFFFFFLENRIGHFMQIVSHEVSDFLGKIRKISSVCHLLNLPIVW